MSSDSDTPVFLAGRAAELECLRRAHAAAQAGHGGCVLLVGEPGIGKTTVAEHWSAEGRSTGTVVAWAHCDAAEGAPPLWPWTQALRAVSTGVDADALLAAAGADAGHLALLLPAWEQTLGIVPTTASLDDPSARFRVFDSVLSFLRVMARHRPLALVFDDLHNADATSLLLLRFLGRRLADVGIIVVATLRDGDAERVELAEIVADLLRSPGAQRLCLSALSTDDVAACIRAHAGLEPAPELVTALHARTDGNPLFVVEFVRLLVAEGMLTAAATEVPDLSVLPESVRTLIARLLRPLSPACRSLLRLVAVGGLEMPRATLAAVTAAGGTAAAAIDELIAEARRARLLSPANATGQVRFSHALVRDVVYAEIPEDERGALHVAIAQAIERSSERDNHIAELALHYAKGAGEVSARKAMQYAEAAAGKAIAIAAYAEAAQLLALAASIATGIADLDVAQRCRLLLALGEAHRASGDRSAARAAFQDAARGARSLARAGRAAEASDLLAGAAIGCAGGWAGAGDIAQFDTERAAAFDVEAVNLLEEALAALADRQDLLRAKVLSQLAVQSHFTASRAERAARSRQAVELAKHCGDPATLGHVLSIDWTVRWTPANTAERLTMAAEIIACAERAGEEALAVGGRFHRITALLELGDADALQREVVKLQPLVHDLRQPQWMWRLRAHETATALMEGRYDSARQLLRAGRDDPHDDSTARLFLALQMTELQRARGQTERLAVTAAVLKTLIDQHPAVPSIRTQLAQLYADLGQLDDARAEIDHLAKHDFSDFPFDLTWVNAMAEAVEACVAVGDLGRTQALYDLLLPYADRHVVVLGGAVCWGSVSRLLGSAAARLQRWDEAAAHFDAALAANRRLGARVWVARTQLDYGAMMLQRHAIEPARYFLEQARSTAQAIGNKLIEERAAALLPMLPSADDTLNVAPLPSEPTVAALERAGDVWNVTYGDRVVRLRHLKGLVYLAHLLRHPDRELHVLELAQLDAEVETPAPASEQPSDATLLDGSGTADDVVLDARAKREYRRRLDELREELEEAERWNDSGRAEHLRAEREALSAQLAAAVGPGGRDRRMRSAAERARTTVAKSIHAAIKRLRKEHPALAEHLAARVRTGYFCSYLSDEAAVRWMPPTTKP